MDNEKEESQEFSRTHAIKLVKGMDDTQAKWKQFDKWVNQQVNRDAKINKASVIKALVLEVSFTNVPGSDHENKNKLRCRDFKKSTVEKVMQGLSVDEIDSINKKYASIRTLVYLANREDKPPESRLHLKKSKMKKIGLSGVTLQRVEAQLPAFLKALSDDVLEVFWRMVNTAYDMRRKDNSGE